MSALGQNQARQLKDCAEYYKVRVLIFLLNYPCFHLI